MEWIALATGYYLDTKLQGANASVERMFTRLLAYCGAHETDGFVPKDAHNYVGLARSKRALDELILRGILRETDDGRLKFEAWDRWQESANDLSRLRRGQRDRKRKQRENDRTMSRDICDMSRVHPTGPHITRHSTEVESTPHVPAAGEEIPGRKVPIDGWRLVKNSTPDSIGHPTRNALSHHASAMLRAGTPPGDVTDCLELWMTKTDAGPGLLPHLLANVVKQRSTPPGHGAATTKTQGWLSLSNDFDHPNEHRMEIES